MSDFLTRLAGRILGTAPILKPWTPSRFEAGPGLEAVTEEEVPHPSSSLPPRPTFSPGTEEFHLLSEPLPPILRERWIGDDERPAQDPHHPGPLLPSPSTPSPGEEGEQGTSRTRGEQPDRPSRVRERGRGEGLGRGPSESAKLAPMGLVPPRVRGDFADSEISTRSLRGRQFEAGVDGPRLRESTDTKDVTDIKDPKDASEIGGSSSSQQSGKIERPPLLQPRSVHRGENLTDVEIRESSELFVFGEREPSRAERPGHVPPPREPETRPEEPWVRSSLVPREVLRETLGGASEASQAAGWTAGERAEPEPTIEITIGRIEVKAPPQPPAPPARPARPGPRISLNEYLRRRREGR